MPLRLQRAALRPVAAAAEQRRVRLRAFRPKGRYNQVKVHRRPRSALAAVFLLLGFGLLAAPRPVAGTPEDHITVLTVKGIIDPITKDYVRRCIASAEKSGAVAVMIRLDTPGGLDSSMRGIVQRIISAEIPTIVYVSPGGARAASAGVFIAAAANFVAMAPGTNIGAAHPVFLGGEPGEVEESKAVNDATAYVKSIAELRDRNVEWLQDAVRKSVSASAEEAVGLRVADFVAASDRDVLNAIDGRQAAVQDGTVTVTVHTKDAELRFKDMTFLQRLLHTIVDPDIAYLLLSIGALAILIEVYHPGLVMPGVTGAVCLVLAFVALGNLPVNWAGVALIGILLFVLELHAPGIGVYLAGGLAAFIVGSLLLFSPFTAPRPSVARVRVDYWLIAVITSVFVAFFLYLLAMLWKLRRVPVSTGPGVLVGQTGVATSELAPLGTAQVASELWTAEAAEGETIRRGDRVVVVEVRGLRLVVRKV
jgi:membrane-bound serine protease (ClpP class)